MEQLLRLPQIRISILEKIVSERKDKIKNSSKLQSSRLEPPLISGQRPFYAFTNDMRSKSICSHLKCNCKNKSHDHYQKLYPFLSKRKKKSQIINKVKTQYSQQESQYKQIRKNKLSNTKDNRQNMMIQKESIYRDNITKFYEKIEKKLYSRILKSNKSKIQKDQFKKQIIDFMMKKFDKKQSCNMKLNQLSITQFNQLVKYVQECIKKKQQHQMMQKYPKHGNNIDQVDNSIQQKVKSKKMIRKIIKNTTEASQINLGQQVQQKQKKKKKTIRIKDKKSDQKQQILDMIIKNDKKQNEQFIKLILNLDMNAFRQKINKIRQILAQYCHQDNIKINIIQTVSSLQAKIKESRQNRSTKQIKLKLLDKILRPQIQETINIQFPELNLNADDVLTSKAKSKKSIKTIKRIQRSQKSQKSFGQFYEEDQLNFNSAFSIKTQTQVSLAQFLQVNRCLQNEQKDIQGKKQHRKLSSNLLRANKTSNYMRIDNIKQMQVQNIPKTQKIVFQQYLTNKPHKPAHLSKNRGQLNQYNQIDQQKWQPISKQENKQNEKQMMKATQSAFKRQYELQMKKLRDKLIIQENKIKQFMSQNKQTVVKGINRLKDENLQLFIIQTTDSLLTKRKKIRKLKQILQAKGHLSKKDMILQILAYINLYQAQSNLILRRKRFESMNSPNQNEKQGEIYLESLIDKGRLFEQMKFITLNKDYCYGEYSDQLNYQKRFSFPQYQLYQLDVTKQIIFKQQDQHNQKSLQRSQLKRFNDLLQKQMGWKGHYQQINLLQYQPDKKQKKTKTSRKNKTRTQQSCEQQISFLKRNKFLLTQNTVLL